MHKSDAPRLDPSPESAASSPVPPPCDLHGRAALVTGGAKRVGRAIALRLASLGADVAVTYRRSEAEAQEVVEAMRSMGRRALAIQADFAQPDAAVDACCSAIERSLGRLDALVNNAASFDPTPRPRVGHAPPDADHPGAACADAGETAEPVDAARLGSQMAVNAIAPALLIHRLAPLLAARGADDPGRVVNFIDIHVMGQPLKGYLAYNMAKAALQEATMTLAMELAPAVTVNAVAPGVVAWADSYTESARSAYMRRVPLARPGTPEDAADAAVFLIRDAAYCTGQIVRLDGGRLLT